MSRLLAWVQGAGEALGGPGLFLLAFLDSSFLSFPNVVDLLVIADVTRHEARWLYYALMPTLGSMGGCYVLYEFARRGGERFLRRRVHERHLERAMAAYQRHGLLGVLVPAILPPPVPFKVFVLAAGVAKVRPVEFLVAVAIGRGIRYFGEALLALYYGDRAAAYLIAHSREAALLLAVLVAVGGTIWVLRRRKQATAEPSPRSD
jgi:membrane protein YqaA with SNARE-associated domain